MHPYKTSSDLQRELLVTGVSVDSSTVRRRLIEVGGFAGKPIEKQLLDQEVSVLDCTRLEEGELRKAADGKELGSDGFDGAEKGIRAVK
ncbi:hypothetical protein TNCV_429341 [Trichonephila clavipes]|nr:hypothetical protein TNCV_429341 [Trichonephila clavipes]